MRKEFNAAKENVCDCRPGQVVRYHDSHNDGGIYECPRCGELWIYRIFKDHSFERYAK